MTFYDWNEDNRMSVAQPPGGAVTLTYNADGQRVQKLTATDTTNFLYDFEKVLQETDAADTVQEEYTSTTNLYGDLLSGYDGTSTSYYEFDAVGSTDALLNDAGSAFDSWIYRAFGQAQSTSATTQPFTFVGKQGYYSDLETGLYLLRARYFDYVLGRFINEDPSGYGPDPNLYRYTRNNPLNFTDPSGLDSVRAENGDANWYLAPGGTTSYITLGSIDNNSTISLGKEFGAGMTQLGTVQNYAAYTSINPNWSRPDIVSALNHDVFQMTDGSSPAQGVPSNSNWFEEGLNLIWGWFNNVYNLIQRIYQFITIFGPNAQQLLDDITSPDTRDKVFTNLLEGTKAGLLKFFGLDSQNPLQVLLCRFQTGFQDLLGTVAKVGRPKSFDPKDIALFVLETLGFGWKWLINILVQALPSGLQWLAGEIQSLAEGGSSKLKTIFAGADELIHLLFDDMGNLDLKDLPAKLADKYATPKWLGELYDLLWSWLTGWLENTLVRTLIGFLASLAFPGGAVLNAIFSGLLWFINNAERILDIAQRILIELPKILRKSGPADVAKYLLTKLFPPLVSQFIDLIGQLVLGTSIQSLVKYWLTGLATAAGALLVKLFRVLLEKIGIGRGKKGGPGCNTGCFTETLWIRDAANDPFRISDPSSVFNRLETVAARDGVQEPAAEDSVDDPAQFRLVSLYLACAPGDYVKAIRVFPVAWLAERNAVVGTRLLIELDDMGIRGKAEVTAIAPCPPIRRGPGRLILGWYMHSRAVVYDLWISGEPEPIGVTALHPFWSQDRFCWVSVCELREGERLLARDGSTPWVESLAMRSAEEPVYTLEVDGDHCYRVGEQGLLVHNISADCEPGPNQLPNCNSANPETDPNIVAKDFLRSVCASSLRLTLDPCTATTATNPPATCMKEIPGGNRYTGTPYACDVKPHMLIPGTTSNFSVHVTCCNCCDRECNSTSECLNAHWGSDRKTGKMGVYPGCKMVP
jgi:RHS repeat-associated protein